MKGTFTAIRRKLNPGTTDESNRGIDPAPATDLYECSACRAMVINPAGERCPECSTGTLARR